MRKNKGETIGDNIADGCNFWNHQIFAHAIRDTSKV